MILGTLALVIGSVVDKTLDDNIDWAAGVLTPILYTMLTAFVTLADLNFECAPPQHWSKEWVQFSETFCKIAPTFVIPESVHRMTDRGIEQYRRKATHWYAYTINGFATAVLITMIPRLIWIVFLRNDDLTLKHFITSSEKIQKLENEEEKKEKIARLAEDLKKKLYSREYSKPFPSPILMIFVTKILYLLFAIAQFVAIPFFLGLHDDFLWSFKLAAQRLTEDGREESALFPRLVFCEFSVRNMGGNNAKHLLYCLTPYNVFHEHIFISMSFWFVSSAILVFFGIIRTANRLIGNKSIIAIVTRKYFDETDSDLEEFSEKFLGTEGKLVVYLMRQSFESVTDELLVKMYSDFKYSKQRTATAMMTASANNSATETTPVEDVIMSSVVSEEPNDTEKSGNPTDPADTTAFTNTVSIASADMSTIASAGTNASDKSKRSTDASASPDVNDTTTAVSDAGDDHSVYPNADVALLPV